MPTVYAHSLPDKPQEYWHDLEQHLQETAERAECFAKPFARGWGRVAGLWHDAGKYQPAFQRRIGSDPDAHTDERVDHSVVGAMIAAELAVLPVAIVIAGHHAGLANLRRVQSRIDASSNLLAAARRNGLPRWLETVTLPLPPIWAASDKRKLALWTRFLFSALVDADFLDTERFYEGQERDQPDTPLRVLRERLGRHIEQVQSDAEPSPVNELRARILRACGEAADRKPGMFSLTVPTGGGKTLASLRFALDHAVIHGLRRVIIVIPFTSIIEQTAAVYRRALGDEVVIEHHSNLDPERETRHNRLASENWDAPVVVTTSVQFFESLYANKPSRCRKLHRISRSVVIFDEVQTFPAELLDPVRDVLINLSSDYGVSLVFCTATQPALGLPVREVVPDVEREFSAVAGRCRILLPENRTAVSWDEIAARLRGREQALAVVNRRADAQTLAQLVGEECLHLSARMCAAHRSAVLKEIKLRLRESEPCRVVSTQLVEAGVDVDFPVVYRAFAGADSLAQAAGRCNREGRLHFGEMQVFFAPSRSPQGMLRVAEQTALTLWSEGLLDLQKSATFKTYFERLYSVVEGDRGVLTAEREFQFEEAARAFRMIVDYGEAVVAPFEDAARRMEDIRRNGISRDALRRLQPYIVNLYPQEVSQLRRAGAIEMLDSRLWCVVKGFEWIYDANRFGFGWQGPVAAEPEELIA